MLVAPGTRPSARRGCAGSGQDAGRQSSSAPSVAGTSASSSCRIRAGRPVGTRIYNQKTGEFTTTLGPSHQPALADDQPGAIKVQSAPPRSCRSTRSRSPTKPSRACALPGPVTQNGSRPRARTRRPRRRSTGSCLRVSVDYPRRPRIRDRRPRDRPDGADASRARSTSCSASRAADRVYTDPALTDYAVRSPPPARDPAASGCLSSPDTSRMAPAHGRRSTRARRPFGLLRGRDYTLPQDMLDVARDVMRRMVPPGGALRDVTADQLLTTILAAVRIPVVPLREPSDVRHSA